MEWHCSGIRVAFVDSVPDALAQAPSPPATEAISEHHHVQRHEAHPGDRRGGIVADAPGMISAFSPPIARSPIIDFQQRGGQGRSGLAARFSS